MSTAKVVPLRPATGDNLRTIAGQMDEGEITHAVICYRMEDGTIKYAATGTEDGTYLIGLLARTAIHFQNQLADGDPNFM